MLVSMVVRPVTSPLTFFGCNILVNRLFLIKNDGGRHKKWEGVNQEKEKKSHIHIFRTNIQMYKTKHALIQYYLIPFQSCITLNCQCMGTSRKDHSKYVDGGRPP